MRIESAFSGTFLFALIFFSFVELHILFVRGNWVESKIEF